MIIIRKMSMLDVQVWYLNIPDVCTVVWILSVETSDLCSLISRFMEISVQTTGSVTDIMLE